MGSVIHLPFVADTMSLYESTTSSSILSTIEDAGDPFQSMFFGRGSPSRVLISNTATALSESSYEGCVLMGKRKRSARY